MGSSTSKQTPSLETEKAESVVEKRAIEIASLTLSDDASLKSGKPLDVSLFTKWEDRLLSDPKNQLALSAFTQGDMLSFIRRREVAISDGVHLFSHKLEAEAKPITNQRASGRCWLFAFLNVMRSNVIKKCALRRYMLILGISCQNFSFLSSICFSGISWRKRIVRSS